MAEPQWAFPYPAWILWGSTPYVCEFDWKIVGGERRLSFAGKATNGPRHDEFSDDWQIFRFTWHQYGADGWFISKIECVVGSWDKRNELPWGP